MDDQPQDSNTPSAPRRLASGALSTLGLGRLKRAKLPTDEEWAGDDPGEVELPTAVSGKTAGDEDDVELGDSELADDGEPAGAGDELAVDELADDDVVADQPDDGSADEDSPDEDSPDEDSPDEDSTDEGPADEAAMEEPHSDPIEVDHGHEDPVEAAPVLADGPVDASPAVAEPSWLDADDDHEDLLGGDGAVVSADGLGDEAAPPSGEAGIVMLGGEVASLEQADEDRSPDGPLLDDADHVPGESATADVATLELLRSTRVDDHDLAPIEPIVVEEGLERRGLFSTPLFQVVTLVIGVLSCLALWQWKSSPPPPPVAERAPETTTISGEVDDAVSVDGSAAAQGAADSGVPGDPVVEAGFALVEDSAAVAAVSESGGLWIVGADGGQVVAVDDVGTVDRASVAVTDFGVLFETDDGQLWLANPSGGTPPLLIADTGTVGIRGRPTVVEGFGAAFVDNAGRAWSLDPASSDGLQTLDQGRGGSEQVVAVGDGLALLNNQEVTLIGPGGDRETIYSVSGRDDGFPMALEAGSFGLAVLDDVGRVWVRGSGAGAFELAFSPPLGGSQALRLSGGDSGVAIVASSGVVFWNDVASGETYALFVPGEEADGTQVDVGPFGVAGSDVNGNGWLFSTETVEDAVLLFQSSTRPAAVDVAVAEFGAVVLDETGDLWLVQSTDGSTTDHTLDTLKIQKVHDAGESGEMVEIIAD